MALPAAMMRGPGTLRAVMALRSDNVSRISSLADRMSSISRHLRNFARKPNQKLGPVSLAEVVADTLEIVGSRLKNADATVSVDLGPDPPAVIANTELTAVTAANVESFARNWVKWLPK